jgi:hypothetical protein
MKKKIVDVKAVVPPEMDSLGLANHIAKAISDFHKKAKMHKKSKGEDMPNADSEMESEMEDAMPNEEKE